MMRRRFVLGIFIGLSLARAELHAQLTPSTQEQHPDWFIDPRQPNEDESEFQSRRAKQAAFESVLIHNEKGNLFTGSSEGGGSGTGIILQVDGEHILILTNEHVVRRSPHETQVVKVAFTTAEGDDEWTFATAVKSSMRKDVAVLLVPRKSLKRAQPQEARTPKDIEHLRYLYQRGRNTFAFGNPLGGRNIFNRGVLSGLPSKSGMEDLMVQTDAPINPGNSGGPLYDESTGVVTAVITEKVASSQVDSVGRAIPITVAIEEAMSLLNGTHDQSQGYIFGRSERVPVSLLQREGVWPLVEKAFPDLLLSQQKYRENARGLQIITDINPETGLQLGDVVIKVDDSYVGADEKEVIRRVRAAANKKITFEVLRGSEILKVEVPVQNQYQSIAEREQNFASVAGLILQMPLLNEAGDYLRGQKGVLVTEIVPGSLGSKLAMEGEIAKFSLIYQAQVGTRIFPIESLKDVHALADHLEKSDHKLVRLYVMNPLRASTSETAPPRVVFDTNGLPFIQSKRQIVLLDSPEIMTSRNGEMGELRKELAATIISGEPYDFHIVSRAVVSRCLAKNDLASGK